MHHQHWHVKHTKQEKWHTDTKHAYTLHTDSVNQVGGPHFWQKVLPRGRTSSRLLHHRGVGVVARCHGCPRALSRVVEPISSRPNRVTPLVSVHLVPGVPDHRSHLPIEQVSVDGLGLARIIAEPASNPGGVFELATTSNSSRVKNQVMW